MADVTANINSIKEGLKASTAEAQRLAQVLSTIDENVNPKRFEIVQKALNDNIAKAGDFKDKISEVNEQINLLSAGSKFERLGKSLGDVGSKIASLDFSGAAESANKLVATSKSITFKDAIGGVKDLGSTFASLGKVLLTNPLFLLTTVITTIISKFDELKGSGGIVGGVFTAIGDSINFVIEKLKFFSDLLGLTDFQTQEKAEKTQKAAEKEQSAIEKRYDQEIALAQAAGKTTTEIELEKEAAVRKSIEQQIGAIASLGKSYEELSEDQQKSLDDLNAALLDSQNRTAVIQAQAAKEAEDRAKEAEQKRIEAENRRAQEAIRIRREIDDVIIALEGDSLRSRLIQIDRYYSDLVKKANRNKDLLVAIEKKKNEEIRIVQEQEIIRQKLNSGEITKIETDAGEARLATKTSADAKLATANSTVNATITAQNKELTEADIKDKQAKVNNLEFYVQAASQTLEALTTLATVFAGKSEKANKKAFEITKATSIAQALASTYLGAQKAYVSQLVAGDITSPVRGGIAAAVATVTGLANVAKIAATKYESKTISGGGPTPSAGSVGSFGSSGFATGGSATPSFNLFGQGNQLNNVGGTQTVQPTTLQAQVNVSVSETEITSKQQFVARVRESATL